MKIPAWLAAFSSVASMILLVVGALRVERLALETRRELREILDASRQPDQPLMLKFSWEGPGGTNWIETPREYGETFSQVWERHKLYVRIAKEE